MTNSPTSRPSATLPIASVALALALCGCAGWDPISDPPPPLEVQPLEIVVNSVARPESPCLLNINRVRAGEHQVTIIGESGLVRVRMLDEAGEVAFRGDNTGQRITTDDAGKVTIHGGEEGSGPPARLTAGTYTVQCRPEHGAPGEAILRVLPARPGY